MAQLTEAQEKIVALTPQRLQSCVNWRAGPHQSKYLDFILEALGSAREDDTIFAPNTLDAYSVYAHMAIAGWVTRRTPHNEPGPWYITPAGRVVLPSPPDTAVSP